MKKFKSLFLVAAALMIGFSSCNNDDYDPNPWPNDGPGIAAGSSMTFRLTLPEDQTRAIGETQLQNRVALTSGTILFSNGVTILRAVPADITAVLNTGAGGGQEVLNLPGGVTHVHFVGNTDLVGMPGIPDLASLTNAALTVVTNNLINVQSQRNVTSTVVPGPGQVQDNVVNIWGATSYLNNTFAGDATNNPRYSAHINLEATTARIEVFNVTGNNLVENFNVTGIFMDNYYETRGVGGTGGVFRIRGVGMGGSYTEFQTGAAGGFNVVPSLTGVVYDVGTWAATPVLASSIASNVGLMRATPVPVVAAPFQVWGYNLFAGAFGAPNPNPANAGQGNATLAGTRTPRIAIRLENVIVREPTTVTFTWTNAAGVPFDIPVDLGVLTLPHELARHQTPGWTLPNSAWFIERAVAHGIVFDNVNLNATPPNVQGNAAFVNEVRTHATHGFANRYTAGRLGAPAGFEHTLFISVRGFRHAGAGGASIDRQYGFYPRHVYQLGSYVTGAPGGSNWTFGPGDLDYIPFRRDIDVTVTVSIQNWVHVPVEPELQ